MGLTIQFVPHAEIEKLSPLTRLHKLLKMAKAGSIIVLEGRLKKEEEAELIQITMQEIDDDFKGIELAVIEPQTKDVKFMSKMKTKLAGVLLGNRIGLTVIGPATLIKEIKQDPSKIQLLTQEISEDTKKGRK